MGLRSEVLDDFKESFDRASHRFVGMERKSTLPALPPSPPFPIFWLARLRSRLLPACPSERSRPRGDPSDPSTQNHAGGAPASLIAPKIPLASTSAQSTISLDHSTNQLNAAASRDPYARHRLPTSGYQSDRDVSAQTHVNYRCGSLSGTNPSCPARRTGASARHNGVFWLDQEEQMKDYFHVGGSRSLKKIGKDEPM